MTVTDDNADAIDLTASAAEVVDAAWNRARAAFASGRTRDLQWRRTQIDGLIRLLDENDDRLTAALAADVGKPSTEGWATDIGATAGEIRHIAKNLAKWAKPRRASLPIAAQPGKGRVIPEPLGVVLIVAPWNYPIQLLLDPLAAALAAGNAVVCKPSELAPATSTLLAELLPRYLDDEAVVVVEGDVPVATALLERKWDHIFFTGSTDVGRIVMTAAAKHLTPVTLELGGKSPAIVDRSADIEVTARRLAWGKFMNAGQTCIAPDYVLVDASVRDQLVEGIGAAVREFYGPDARTTPDFARIVNEHHLDRLTALLEDHGATVAFGGHTDPGDRYLSPTVLVDPSPDAAVMQQEIFGPILPVLTVDDLDAAIAFVNDRPKPLALYVFSSDDEATDRVLESTSSGGVCVNHVILHISPPELPFGGVGDSGMGRYHGQSGFDTFSNLKSVLRKKTRPDVKLLYPPYTALKDKLFRKAL
ncbi:MAG: aldehyde dehydrogenase family protein [Acidimicrobiia bacterium]|nr:aldehyde dehydrogenase family protein [Acidimicrobiia bacterium]MDH5237164.1 aldehyde dehydrogenase family protein [Acidimicrobiia bacterium]